MVVKEVKLPASAKTITVVGMGMSPEDLSEKALSVIKKADILIGGKRHLGCFLTLPVQKIPIYKNLKEILKIITASAKKNKKVVVLASGDPGYHGIAHYLVTHLGKQRITILPNITTFQAAFAKIKENWDDAFLLSLHGKPIPRMASLLKKHRKMGLLTDHKNTPGRIAKSVLTEDASLKNTPVFILEKLGTQEEKIHKYLLKNVVKKTFASLNVMIFISPSGDERAGEGTRLGIPDNLFSRQGELITKNDIRVLTLAKLNLPKQGVFWDIGSGSGSVAIEAAGLSPELEIVAIEKYEKRIDDIRKNIRKFHAEGTITPILGEAPQILKKLPKPHRIFVGGTEGALLAVLRYCRRALLPSGKIVINAATIETVNETMAFFDKIGWPSEVTLLNISRMKKIGNRGRLQPLNPVFIIEGSKPADNR